jgi:hypothetical protein
MPAGLTFGEPASVPNDPDIREIGGRFADDPMALGKGGGS